MKLNGDWKSWLVGVFTTFITIGGIAWLSAVHAEINSIKNALAEKGEQIARIEVSTQFTDQKLKNIDTQLEKIDLRLEKISDKIDAIKIKSSVY